MYNTAIPTWQLYPFEKLTELKNMGGIYAEYAKEIDNARKSGALECMVVKTKVGADGLVQAPEFVIKAWDQVGKTLF
jgi:hypothetical protein